VIAYVVRRLLLMIPLLWGITLISFGVMHLAPGEPTDILVEMNPRASPEVVQRIRALYGLDRPLWVQYLLWLKRMVRLDFGHSFLPDRRPVMDKIAERIPVTLTINAFSLLLILAVAVPLGVISAVHHESWLDRTVTVFVFLGFAAPTFWLALLAMELFGIKLGWLPISGITSLDFPRLTIWGKLWDLARHLVLPVSLSAFTGLAVLCRYTRASMLEVIHQEYITAARARGLPERAVILRHALRNALLPLITILGLSLPGLLGGSVIFESIFAIPGLGQLFYQSVMSRDYPVVMGMLVIGAVLTLLGNLLADVGYALADPRVRLGER